ncbi:type IV secretion system DNA-binding domain-containing protein [Candidatus Kaiserbacteria bacterium]|nr:type IV secretion system DNA-binding domain-containing protein [Candidatus Kaiserbacteria bacterium]
MSDHPHEEHGHEPKVHPDQHNDDRRVTYFASTHTRGKREMFGIRAVDRGKHVYVIGKTGMGKSTMLENMAIQDIQNGEGISFIDPHGSTAEKLLDFIPQSRINDVVYFAPFDTDYPLGFNVMEDVGYDKRHLVVSGLMGALKRIWVDAWSARMEYILQNTLLALLEYPDSTLLDVNRMLTNKTFRLAVIEKVTDPIVKAFWTEEFAAFTDTYTREATPAIQNKIGQFTANPLIRNIVGQARSSFDLREVMDKKKIFIVNLSKGRMGETNASLLGSMLTIKIYLAAMSRADEPAARLAKLPRHYFYVDEFQSMMNEAFADILSESRKYKLALTLANQYIEQMEEEVRDAVFGNVGTLIVFRVGPFDAEVLETVFKPTFLPEDLVGLGLGQIYLTLMIDGVGSAPFSAETIPPIEAPAITYRDDAVSGSRDKYGRNRAAVEAEIQRKQVEFVPPPKEKKERKDSYGTRPRDESQNRFTAPSPGREPRTVLAARQSDSPRPAEQSQAPNAWTAPAASPRTPIQPRAPRPEPDERNSLRAAIEKARAERIASPAAPSRSPADILREKREQKHTTKPHAAPREPSPGRPPHAEGRESEQAQPQKTAHDKRDGEIAHATLREVLHVRDDEN